MTPKQQAIKEAYGPFYEPNQALISKNGYVTKHIAILMMEKGLEMIEYDSSDTKYIPETLLGIQHNNGWIRVDEQLPKEKGHYIVMNKDGHIEQWYYSKGRRNEVVWREYFTHWRHIVELPKPIY